MGARGPVACAALALVFATATASAQTSPPRVRRLVEAVAPSQPAVSVTVALDLDLDDAGRVTRASVSASGGTAFDEAALAAARDLLFEPARENGRAVASRTAWRYVFAARGERPSDEDAPRAQGTVDPSREATVRLRAPSRETFRRELLVDDLRRMPGTRGDALLAVQNLPGVGRAAFGQGAFIVRGSDPEDTLVTLESQPIALPFHFYGLATTVATDLVERIEFMPGNFSARWGRAAGGVVNITLRAPPRDRPHVAVDVDIIDAGAVATVPLGRRVTVMAGLRRSYVDALLAAFAADAAGASFSTLPVYWDWQLAVDAEVSPRDNVRVLGSGSDDLLGLNVSSPSPEYPASTISYGQHIAWHGAQARWRHRFSSTAEHTLSPSVTWNWSDVSLGSDIRYAITSTTASVRDELDLRLGRRARLFAGLDVQAGTTEAVITAPPLAANGVDDAPVRSRLVRYADTRAFVNPAAYAELSLDPATRLHMLAGVRVDAFSRNGQWSVDPRFSLRYAAHPRLALRAGFGAYTTTPRGYTVLPGFGNPDLALERWRHGTVGLQSWIVDGVLEFTLDGFMKYGDQTASPSNRVIERDGQRVAERFASTGNGRVYGLEAMLRLRPGRVPLLAWLSYTLQRAERRDSPGDAWYTSPWDQPHVLTLVLGAVLPHGWEAGLRARYTSGSPEPRVTGALYDADHDVALTWVDRANPSRLPDFFSLDLRVSKRFRWGPVDLQVIAEVLNATNQSNVESRIYSFDRRSSVPVTGLPILPSVGVRGEY